MKKYFAILWALILGVFLPIEADAATRAGLTKKQCPKGTVTVIIENIPRCVDKQDHIEYLKEQEEKYRKASEAEQAAADAIGVEIRGVEQDIAQTEAALPGAIQKREDAWLAAKDSFDHFDEKIAPIRNQKTETVGGLPLGSLKDGLNDAAGNLESVKGKLRSIGWKEEDIQKLVDYVGVDPERLARAVREVADTVKPQMDMKDLYGLKEKLESRLNEVKADEAKIKNTAAKERAELARYDADIAKAKGEKNASNQSRMDHDKLADGYDAECKRDWVTCAWNIPKAAWERSMAALDQANMNRIDAWIGLLNFGKALPSLVVAGSDLKAVPFTGMRQLIEKQLSDVETARTDLRAKIDREADKARGELNKEYKSLKAEHKKAKKEVERLEGNLISLPVKKEVLVAKKTERENEATRLRLNAEGYRSQLAALGVKVDDAAASVATAGRSTQSLGAKPEDFEKRIQQAEMQSREAKNKMIAAEQRYQSKLEQVKRGEGIDTGRKPLPALDQPAVVKPIGGRDWEQEWQTIRRQEAAALAQHQRRLEEGKAAFERHYALEKKPHDLKLAKRDQEVEEAKRKAAAAEAAMKKALAEAEAKKAVPVITAVEKTAVEPEEIVTIYGKNFITGAGNKKEINFKELSLVQGNKQKIVIANAGKNRGEEQSVFFWVPKDAEGSYSLKIWAKTDERITWDKPPITVAKKLPPLPVITGVSRNKVEVGEPLSLYGKSLITQDASGFTSMNFKKLYFAEGRSDHEVMAKTSCVRRGKEECVRFSAPKKTGSYSIKMIAKTGEVITWNNPLVAVVDTAAEEAAKKKAEEELAKKKALEEEAKKKEQEELAKKEALEEELAKKKAEEELAGKKAEEELAMKQKQEEEAQRRQREQEELEHQRREEEIARQQREEELRRRQEQEEIARRQREEDQAPASSGQYCNPDVPRYSQPGCIEPPVQEGPPPTQGQPCNPNVPRYAQPGCVE